jgi:hypothetical protein
LVDVLEPLPALPPPPPRLVAVVIIMRLELVEGADVFEFEFGDDCWETPRRVEIEVAELEMVEEIVLLLLVPLPALVVVAEEEEQPRPSPIPPRGTKIGGKTGFSTFW